MAPYRLRDLFLGLSLTSMLMLGVGASAQLAEKKTLTLEAAKKMAAAAEAEAKKNNWRMIIAIVDDGGHLVYLQRLDEGQTASVDLAVQKARSAAAYKRPTKVFEDALVGGRQAILGLSGAVPLDG
ncbi:MAG: GlcG/HbpS family heme-binding protein [Burkholderiales bacterium]